MAGRYAGIIHVRECSITPDGQSNLQGYYFLVRVFWFFALASLKKLSFSVIFAIISEMHCSE